MFNNMKNKIREKTGTELPKFTASSTSLFGKKSNQHSRQSSQGSINSTISDLSAKEENDPKSSHSASRSVFSDDAKPIDVVKTGVDDDEITIIKCSEKEKEWREKEKAYVSDLLKQTKELQEALLLTEELKTKLQHCQEEKEQLEIYQKQEVTKIKQLLLAKEEENDSNLLALKEALASIESLKLEVNRLKPLEEQINTCQVQDEQRERYELEQLTQRLQVLMKENEALRSSNKESRRLYDESLSKESNKNSALDVEIARLKEYSRELELALQKEKNVKDQTLLRNAEISQLVQLTEQELKQQQIQNEELFKKVACLEEQLDISRQNLKKLQHDGTDVNEQKCAEKIEQLENEIADKNKVIRILQQNLNDVKKTFHNELKNSTATGVATTTTTTTTTTTIPPTSTHSIDDAATIANCDSNINSNCNSYNNDVNHDNDYDSREDDINFKYMKHVLIKFLTSSEYEAQQLTKAVATLLKLNSEEEKLIKDTLEWRSSWFGSKPRVKLHYTPS